MEKVIEPGAGGIKSRGGNAYPTIKRLPYNRETNAAIIGHLLVGWLMLCGLLVIFVAHHRSGITAVTCGVLSLTAAWIYESAVAMGRAQKVAYLTYLSAAFAAAGWLALLLWALATVG